MAAWRDLDTASWVTQHVFTTATSAPAYAFDVPVREQSLPYRLRVGERDLAAEKARRERRHGPRELRRLGGADGLRPIRRAPADPPCVQPGAESRSCARYPEVTASRASSDRSTPSTTSRAIFATATSDGGSSTRIASTTADVEHDPLTAALTAVTSDATGSTSTARTGRSRAARAAIARTPEPQPTSSSDPRSRRASNSTHSRVVGWAPVPNARPGSMTTAGSSGR